MYVIFFFFLSSLRAVVSDLTLRISQVSGFFHTLGGLGSPSAPLPVLLFPLSCQVCGLTLEEVDLQESKANEEEEGEEERGPVYSCVFLIVPFVVKHKHVF